MKDSKIIQYQDINSWLTRLSGLTKFLVLIFWIATNFITFDIRILIFNNIFAIIGILTSKIKLSKFAPYFKIMLFFLIVNSIAIYLFSPRQGFEYFETRTFLIGDSSLRYSLTLETLEYLIVVSSKYLSMFSVAILFMYCTNPSEFASSLSKIKVSHSIAYSIALALRYIPEISDSFVNISNAQSSKGVNITKKVKLSKRFSNVKKMMIPLVFSSLDRIEVITDAMALRGFGRHKKRTWYHSRKLRFADFLLLIFVLCILALSIYLRFIKKIRFVSLLQLY